ncbi:MAG: hypothetical protein IT313_13965 [Anaerolineales bacterium]|nr:hypothetical protein [Anaerolineales bacterium]
MKKKWLEKEKSNLSARLPTPEDLIIMKAIAHRPKDLEDIRTIVDKHPVLDHRRIKQWVQDYAELMETPELWETIEKILRAFLKSKLSLFCTRISRNTRKKTDFKMVFSVKISVIRVVRVQKKIKKQSLKQRE